MSQTFIAVILTVSWQHQSQTFVFTVPVSYVSVSDNLAMSQSRLSLFLDAFIFHRNPS